MAGDHNLPAIQLKDVYDMAQTVGEQFQKLIECFGSAQIAELIPTVVNALEYLESFVEDNQRLQMKNCKLMLENDSLVKEKGEKEKSSTENIEVLRRQLQIEQRERKQLSLQVEMLEAKNKQQSPSRSNAAAVNSRLESPLSLDNTNEPTITQNGHQDLPFPQENKTLPSVNVLGEVTLPTMVDPAEEGSKINSLSLDVMDMPRMNRRLSMVENELSRTRSKLFEVQNTCQEVVAENNALKAQLEESRAEVGLQTLQLTNSEACHVSGTSTVEPPKFYKKDLMIVLRERNELKEELDAVRDDLNMTKRELKTFQIYSQGHPLTKRRSNTRVRDIVESITEESIRKSQHHGKKIN